jgi:predicted nucleic acid-binding protein
MIIVLDNSAVVNLLGLDPECPKQIQEFKQELLNKEDAQLFVPDLFHHEFGNTIVKKIYRKQVPKKFKEGAYILLQALNLETISLTAQQKEEITDLANSLTKKHNQIITHYDATYLYLAKEKKAKLLTLDKQLIKIAGTMCYIA